jgi:tetratricopeptide (TPR) repeat protein
MLGWSFLAKTFWIYFGLLFRAFGNRFGWSDAYQGALSCFSRALEHAPQDAYLYLWRGTLYWREFSATQKAEADLTRAIELDPRLARAYLNRAFARWYALPPDRPGAAADFRAFLERSAEPYWRGVVEELLQQFAAAPGGAEAANHLEPQRH